MSTISSPDGRFVVSFALGPRASLPATYESFVDLLESSFGNVRVESRRTVRTASGTALAVGGRATNAAGGPVRFRALLLSPPGRPALGAIAATRSRDPFNPRITEILKSVRPL